MCRLWEGIICLIVRIFTTILYITIYIFNIVICFKSNNKEVFLRRLVIYMYTFFYSFLTTKQFFTYILMYKKSLDVWLQVCCLQEGRKCMSCIYKLYIFFVFNTLMFFFWNNKLCTTTSVPFARRCVFCFYKLLLNLRA